MTVIAIDIGRACRSTDVLLPFWIHAAKADPWKLGLGNEIPGPVTVNAIQNNCAQQRRLTV